MAGFAPLLLQHFTGSGPLPQDSSQDQALPALSKHAGGGRLHNSFPISCALHGRSRPCLPSVTCLLLHPHLQPSLLSPNPPSFPAILHLPAPCTSSRPFLSGRGLDLSFPPAGSILPSPSLEKGPCAFALSRGAVCAVPCRQAPARCSGEVDTDFPMLSTSFKEPFFHSHSTETRAIKIQIKNP